MALDTLETQILIFSIPNFYSFNKPADSPTTLVRRKIKIEPVPDLEVFSVFHENIVLQGYMVNAAKKESGLA